MRQLLALLLLSVAAAVFHLTLAPLLPPVLRPDAALLLAMAALALGRPDFGFVALFVLGLQADLFLSARMGALTLGYLLSGAAVRVVVGREFERGEIVLAWISVTAATAVAHLLYCGIVLALGSQIVFGEAFVLIASLALSALLWGLPALLGVGELLFRLHLLAPEIQARWTNQRRMNGTRIRRAHS
jgi:hypothetical protein